MMVTWGSGGIEGCHGLIYYKKENVVVVVGCVCVGGGGDYRNSDHKFIVRYGSSLEMLATRVKNLTILSFFP